jgi:hypothetical protein
MTSRDEDRQGAATLRCAGEPVSWLALERLRLGELPPDEHRAVEQHLAACAACAACLVEIERPLSLPALPAILPGILATATFWSRVRAAWRGAGRARVWAPAGVAGVASVLALLLVQRPWPVDAPLAGETLAGVKGGGVALSLVRERDGAIEHGATTFSGRDRWKALVTCPAPRMVFWDAVVLDGSAPAFPLAPAAPIACGNRVPLPGAFRLDGEHSVEVCLLLAADPIDRSTVTARASVTARAGGAFTCVTLRPER